MTDTPQTTAVVVTLTINAAELLRIYEAGIKRGNDEAVSADWGSRPSGDKLDELRNAMVWGHPSPILPGDFDEREAAWTRMMEAMQNDN